MRLEIMCDCDDVDVDVIKNERTSPTTIPVDWHERCIHLQVLLQKINAHSEQERQALLSKISQLELKLRDKEEKMDENREERFRCSSPELMQFQLKKAMEEKERIIIELEQKIEEQKKMRLNEAKQVEVKTSKIKEWVEKLEEQNLNLREENRKYSEELKMLRQKLQNASPNSRRKIENELERFYDQHDMDKQIAMKASTRTNPFLSDFKDEEIQKESLNFSSSSDDEENVRLKSISADIQAHRKMRQQKPVPPPRTRIGGGNNSLVAKEESPPTPQHTSRLLQTHHHKINIPTRGGSLDRKLSEMKKLNFNELRKKRVVAAADEIHDYSEIYTPSKELKTFLPNIKNMTCNQYVPRAPTPPLHRCPSWESRIYKIASAGIKSVTTTPTHSMRSTRKQVNVPSVLQYDWSNLSYEINVPVFATIQGRASQIRSMPYTGDSSDSSDNETDGRYTMTTTGTTSSSGNENDIFCTPMRRRVRRGLSVESQLSGDYVIPPDASMTNMSQSQHDSSCQMNDHVFEPRTPKRYSSLQRSLSPNRNRELFEKSGYLTKLGGKLKTWRRRWFVLKEGVIYYYKSQNEVSRSKPKGKIVLGKDCRVSMATGSATFQIITGNNKKVYYLTADSVLTMEEWIRVLQNSIKRSTLFFLKDDCKPIIEGWLVKVKHGHSKRCWCALIGRNLVYYRSASDLSMPIGLIDLKGAKVEEVNHTSDSDNDDNDGSLMSNKILVKPDSDFDCTIAIFLKDKESDPVYLHFADKMEMENWLYHLMVVSSGDHIAGTPFEHVVSRLMQAELESAETIDGHTLWKDNTLWYTKENLTHPLSTLPNEYLRSEAIKMFKSVQLFISVPLDSAGIDYHVSLVQNLLQLCLSQTELQSELFFQLVKQTFPHPQSKLCTASTVHQLLLCATQSIFTCDSTHGQQSEKTSPTSNIVNLVDKNVNSSHRDKSNPPNHVFIQAFQILSLAISLFVCKSRALWLLKHHLRRSADSKTDIGKYAIYCERALERTIENGQREFRPSRMEILSILLRNPYHHSLPHSIPIHFCNESYVVIGFDGSSCVHEFIDSLNSQVDIRPTNQSGFALYSDDPLDACVQHLVDINAKLSDVIAKWEIVLREKHLGKFENTRVIKLIYKQRLCLKNQMKNETDKEKLLIAYQFNSEIINGFFPLTHELALELAALLAQIEFGDFVNINKPINILKQILDKFYPKHLRETFSMKSLMDSIRDKWMELRGRSTNECVRIYLNCARKWPLSGAKLFEAKPIKALRLEETSSCIGVPTALQVETQIWIAINEEAVFILDYDTFQVIARYAFANIMAFGGCKEDFMMVVSAKTALIEIDSGSGSGSGSSRTGSVRSERMLFSMSKAKISEMTLLLADYINCESTCRLDTTDLKNELCYNICETFNTKNSSKSTLGSFRVNNTHTKL